MIALGSGGWTDSVSATDGKSSVSFRKITPILFFPSSAKNSV